MILASPTWPSSYLQEEKGVRGIRGGPAGAAGWAQMDSHKEEACADVVRDGADPDVAVFLQVLGGDHCWDEGLLDAGWGTEGTAPCGDPTSPHPPGDPVGAARAPRYPPQPQTFAKGDAVQVAALEEAGLDGAGLWEEQPCRHPVPSTRGCHVPVPTLPQCPLAHQSPGGWCSSGCTAAPAHPSTASGAALSPFLREKQGCHTLREHPGVKQDTCHRQGPPPSVLPPCSCALGTPPKVCAAASEA